MNGNVVYVGVKLIALVVFFSFLIFFYSAEIATFTLPIIKIFCGYITNNFDIQSIKVVTLESEPVYKATFLTINDLKLNGQAIPNGLKIFSETLFYQSMQTAALLSIVTIMPVKNIFNRLILILLVSPFIVFLPALDASLVLLGACENLLLDVFQSSPYEDRTFLVHLMVFLNGGGRLFLPFLVVMVIYSIFMVFEKWINRKNINKNPLLVNFN